MKPYSNIFVINLFLDSKNEVMLVFFQVLIQEILNKRFKLNIQLFSTLYTRFLVRELVINIRQESNKFHATFVVYRIISRRYYSTTGFIMKEPFQDPSNVVVFDPRRPVYRETSVDVIKISRQRLQSTFCIA